MDELKLNNHWEGSQKINLNKLNKVKVATEPIQTSKIIQSSSFSFPSYWRKRYKFYWSLLLIVMPNILAKAMEERNPHVQERKWCIIVHPKYRILIWLIASGIIRNLYSSRLTTMAIYLCIIISSSYLSEDMENLTYLRRFENNIVYVNY